MVGSGSVWVIPEDWDVHVLEDLDTQERYGNDYLPIMGSIVRISSDMTNPLHVSPILREVSILAIALTNTIGYDCESVRS